MMYIAVYREFGLSLVTLFSSFHHSHRFVYSVSSSQLWQSAR